MSSPASIKGHPIHPMLVAFPVGLLVFSLISDIIYIAEWGGPVWNDVAYYTMLGGVVGALLAAVPGFIDYLSIHEPKTKRTATKHMTLNLIVVALFIINLIIRSDGEPETTLPFMLSIVGVGILAYSGWLGGDMVYEHGMGVELTADGHLKKDRPRPYNEAEETKRGPIGEPRTQSH